MLRLLNLLDEAPQRPNRLDLLLGAHACVKGAIHVPRAFLPETVSALESALFLETLLLSHPLSVRQKTLSTMRPYWEPYCLDAHARQSLLCDIEDTVCAVVGPGKIVYEESRFTPYGSSLFGEAQHAVENHGLSRISLSQLYDREFEKHRAPQFTTAGKPVTPVNFAQRVAFERKWASRWLDSSAYTRPGSPERTLRALVAPSFEGA